jgi:hypothetical protein
VQLAGGLGAGSAENLILHCGSVFVGERIGGYPNKDVDNLTQHRQQTRADHAGCGDCWCWHSG